MTNFKSATPNKYSEIQNSASKPAIPPKTFTPSVKIGTSYPFSNKTANLTRKKVIFKHV